VHGNVTLGKRCEAVRSAILATAWLLVIFVSILSSQFGINQLHLHQLITELVDVIYLDFHKIMNSHVLDCSKKVMHKVGLL